MKTIKNIILEHYRFRKQIIELAKVEFKKENSNSVLGSVWNVLKPLITICVFWFAFAIGLRNGSDIDGVDFFVWLLIGIVPWFYISGMLTKGAKVLKKNSYLVNKMKFPISVIPTVTNLAYLAIHIILLLVSTVIFVCFGNEFNIYIVQLPIYIGLTFIFINLWSFLTSILVVFSKDLFQVIKSLVMPLFWLSGILWSVDNIDNEVINMILTLNPITYIVTGYRNSFFGQEWFFEDTLGTIIFLGYLVVLGILGLIAYIKLRKEIPDVL